MKKQIESVWKNPEEYFNFGMEHKVWGKEAVELKKELEKKSRIPEPKVRIIKERTK